VEIGSSGRNADGGVFAESEFGKALENENLHLPQPGSLPKKPTVTPCYLMKSHPGKFLSEEKKIFNYRLSRARRVIENAFAIAAARWRVLRKPSQASA
jgi:hypothetical protein